LNLTKNRDRHHHPEVPPGLCGDGRPARPSRAQLGRISGDITILKCRPTERAAFSCSCRNTPLLPPESSSAPAQQPPLVIAVKYPKASPPTWETPSAPCFDQRRSDQCRISSPACLPASPRTGSLRRTSPLRHRFRRRRPARPRPSRQPGKPLRTRLRHRSQR
jgi:hypothetical protein